MMWRKYIPAILEENRKRSFTIGGSCKVYFHNSSLIQKQNKYKQEIISSRS